jgi:hypothetical protein
MKFTNLFLGVCIVFLSACATTYTLDKLTPDEQGYMTKVNNASPTFEMEKAKSDEAWSRGNSFISRFSGMRVQSSNEYLVSTYDPNASDNGTIGYTLMKELNGNKVKFTITCQTKALNFKFTPDVCRNNEKVMAHYMATGELNEKFVNSKFSAGSTTGK